MSWEIWADEPANRLCARFEGALDAAGGEASATEFVTALGLRDMHVVFDIRQMTSYATASRTTWRHALWPLRQQLLSMTLIGGSALVRMGGQILGFALGLPVRSVDTWEELQQSQQPHAIDA